MRAVMQNVTIIHGGDNAAIVQWLAECLKDASAITIPGGSTPFPILEALIASDAVNWTGMQVWPNDDRIVPEDHEASNTGKIRALFEPVGAHVVALLEDQDVPEFDLMWLGMG